MSWRLDHDVNPAGTRLIGHISTSYAKLAAMFGPGRHLGGDGRTTCSWTFVATDGEVVTLYEFKATSEYGYEDDPTVEEFRALPEYAWHVGASRDELFAPFLEWLRGMLADVVDDAPEPKTRWDRIAGDDIV